MPWTAAPILACTDVRRAAEWYRDALGFELAADGLFEGVDEAEGAVYGIVRREGQAIHLQIRRRDLHRDEREAIETDAYVNVGDVDALYEEYLAAGVAMLRPIYDEPYGMRDFCIVDVEGNRVAFGAPVAG